MLTLRRTAPDKHAQQREPVGRFGARRGRQDEQCLGVIFNERRLAVNRADLGMDQDLVVLEARRDLVALPQRAELGALLLQRPHELPGTRCGAAHAVVRHDGSPRERGPAEASRHTITIDISDPASVLSVRGAVLAVHPDLNVLIAMAGIMVPEDVTTADSVAAR